MNTRTRRRTRSLHPSRPASPGPAQLRAIEQEALKLMGADKFDQAEPLLRKILEIEAGNPLAMHYLGVLAHVRGDHERALTLEEKSIALDAGVPFFHNNLGLLLTDMGRRREALEAFEKAVALKSDYASAHHNAGTIYMEANHLPAAESHFRSALAGEPTYRLSLKALPTLLERLGRRTEAIAGYEEFLRLYPDDPDVLHLLNALQGKDSQAAPEEYVAGLFDGYADRFENHLTRALRYDVPAQLRETVCRAAGVEQAGWRVLDMGCGTGLCGPLFRDLAAHLSGVDLSPKMLAKAKEKNVYDHLVEGNLLDALSAEDGTLDLAIAADVLIYVGALEPVFAACKPALKEGGLLAFSAETCSGEDFLLRASGRYAHSVRYVENLAEKHGFSVILREECVIRTDQHRPIGGHLYVLRKGRGGERLEEQTVAFDPSNPEEAYETALLHRQAGNLAHAEGLFLLILRDNPAHAGALHGLGLIAYQTGHLDAAHDLMRQAIAHKPDMAICHAHLGIVLHGQGRTDEGIASLLTALKLNPASSETMSNLANLLTSKGDLDRAEKLFAQAISLNPSAAETHNNLGVVQAMRGKNVEAEESYRKAVELNPEYDDAHRNLAGLLQTGGRPAEAAESWRRVLRLRPEDADARARLAACEAEQT